MKPYYERNGITIYHGDCREILPGLPSVDLVLTDPPYGIGYSTRRRISPAAIANAGGVYGKDWGSSITGDSEPFNPANLLAVGVQHIFWGAHHFAPRLPSSGGWLVWDKRRNGTVSANFHGAHVDMAWTDVIGSARIFSHLWVGFRRDTEVGQHLHPTQKPVALMKWCLELAGGNGLVIDPYMGSGPTLEAAKHIGRKAIGIEIEERYCEIAARRLEQEVLVFS